MRDIKQLRKNKVHNYLDEYGYQIRKTIISIDIYNSIDNICEGLNPYISTVSDHKHFYQFIYGEPVAHTVIGADYYHTSFYI